MSHVETKTNQHLRKKYFVDADSILTRRKTAELPATEQSCRVIGSSQVRIAKTPRQVCAGVAPTDTAPIDVHLLKNGSRIQQIRISCPCGRHAELDCRYEAEEARPRAAAPENPQKRGAA